MLLILLIDDFWFNWMWSFQSQPFGYGVQFVSPGNWVVAPFPALVAVVGLLAASRFSLNRGGHVLVLGAVLWASFMSVFYLPETYWLTCAPGYYWRFGDLMGLFAVCVASLGGVCLRALLFTSTTDTPKQAWYIVAAVALAIFPSATLACRRLLSIDVR
jgi:hypothetical protein